MMLAELAGIVSADGMTAYSNTRRIRCDTFFRLRARFSD